MAYKQIPDFVLDIIRSGDLSKTDMRVYASLLGHTSSNRGAKGRVVWPSRRTLMEESGCRSWSDLTNSLQHLEALGCIVIERRGGKKENGRGRANHYTLPMEPPSKEVQNAPLKKEVQNAPRDEVQNAPHKRGAKRTDNPYELNQMKRTRAATLPLYGDPDPNPAPPATADEIRDIIGGRCRRPS